MAGKEESAPTQPPPLNPFAQAAAEAGIGAGSTSAIGVPAEAGDTFAPAVSSAKVEEDEEADASKGGEDEDTGAQISPIVKLEEVSVSSGEENEAVLFEIKSKLYRFDKERSEWKERGVGQVKLLEDNASRRVRLLMRQQRTLKICANHMVLPGTQLQEHAGSDKAWVWHATDFADGELKEELFAMRFGSIESKPPRPPSRRPADRPPTSNLVAPHVYGLEIS